MVGQSSPGIDTFSTRQGVLSVKTNEKEDSGKHCTCTIQHDTTCTLAVRQIQHIFTIILVLLRYN